MKVRRLLPHAVNVARETLIDADVRGARDIHVEAIAARHGVMVLYGPVTTARAHIVRVGRRAVVRVDASAKGEAHARFTIAHELGHHLLHDDDHFVQCTDNSEPRRGRAWHVEREANDFATELLIPHALGAAYCEATRPVIDDVERLARVFKTSLVMSAIRFVELSRAPCAAAMVVEGKVRWATESATFPGKIVKGRAVPASAAASRDALPRVVPAEAWGGTEPFLEHRIPLASAAELLCWVTPAS
ncbi:MAG: ImmA/IrrE family metallo-endopeptidase [Polyangiales bacterium]